jgi:N6-adenosine-specific RNA methylase IME4
MVYRTIVADPPWPYPEGFGIGRIPKGTTHDKRRSSLPYPSMSVEDICGLPVKQLADQSGCHVYLWTTNRYLRQAFIVLEAWGFRYGQTLVWSKPLMGSGLGGAYPVNVEFVLFGRCGTLPHKERGKSAWFSWPRTGKHSKKPEAFIDMVETVSPGPYLEMFARHHRLGWDVFGDEVNSISISNLTTASSATCQAAEVGPEF